MIELPGGEFWMGSPQGRVGAQRRRNPTPSASVWVCDGESPSDAKAISRKATAQSPSHFKRELLPVDRVSWFDAVRFCNKLSEMVGLSSAIQIGSRARAPGADGEAAQAKVQPDVEWDQTADWLPVAHGGRVGVRLSCGN